MQDPTKAKQVEIALNAKKPKSHFIGAELVMLEYTEKLTLKPGEMVETDVIKLRENGVDDGQILELNQIIGYFNYVNRLLNGLGVTTSGDTVGFYKD
jgi:alkylhydroperoxidase family enzyme